MPTIIHEDEEHYYRFIHHLQTLLQSYTFITTDWNNRHSAKLEEVIHRKLHMFNKFHANPRNPKSMVVRLKDLTSVAKTLGCVHASEAEEKACRWQELHHMIGRQIEDLAAPKM